MRKTLSYVSTDNWNNPDLFREIIKKFRRTSKLGKIKEIQDTTKIIKSQGEPKNHKIILTSSTFGENNKRIAQWNNKWCKICDIIIEGKSYTLKNPEIKIQNT